MKKIDRMPAIDTRHLAALEAVASESSFSRAADRLGYTQSAVSHQIGLLEAAVGQRLLERPGGRRAVSLTDAGRLVLRHAQAILGRLRALEADVAALAAGEAGTLRVGAYQSVGARLLPRLFARFTAARPGVEADFVESANDDELLALVERGELDVAFVTLPFAVPGTFEAVELLRDPFVLLVPRDSPLARRATPPGRAELEGLRLIGHPQTTCQRRLEAELEARGVEARFAVRSGDNATLQGLVAAGLGSALVPLLSVDAGDERIAVLEPGLPLPPRTIGAAWHRDRFRSPAALAFVEEAVRLCAELSRAGSPSSRAGRRGTAAGRARASRSRAPASPSA